MFPFLGQAVASIGKNRRCPPEAWLMTTSRLAWLGSQEDTQNRPLLIADKDGTGELDVLAFPVKLTDAMPTNLGAGTNQDAIIACRPSDFLLFESQPRTMVSFDNSLSGTLQVRIHLHRSVAVLFRYPSAIAAIQGTGTIVQSGF
jgi:HK97 family phage major capsid protein